MPLLRQEQYDALLEAFRKNPGNATAAEESTGITAKTARKVWLYGVERRNLPPIKEVLEREEEQRKQSVRAVEVDQKTRARQDAVDQEARELQAGRSTLSTALSNLAVLGVLSGPILKLARAVAGQVERMADGEAVDLPVALEVLREYGVISARASLVAKRAVEIGRLLVGEPGQIIGHQHTFRPGADVSPIYASRAIEAFGGNEEEVKEAARDLFEGRMTERALRLIESQALVEDPRSRS